MPFSGGFRGSISPNTPTPPQTTTPPSLGNPTPPNTTTGSGPNGSITWEDMYNQAQSTLQSTFPQAVQNTQQKLADQQRQADSQAGAAGQFGGSYSTGLALSNVLGQRALNDLAVQQNQAVSGLQQNFANQLYGQTQNTNQLQNNLDVAKINNPTPDVNANPTTTPPPDPASVVGSAINSDTKQTPQGVMAGQDIASVTGTMGSGGGGGKNPISFVNKNGQAIGSVTVGSMQTTIDNAVNTYPQLKNALNYGAGYNGTNGGFGAWANSNMNAFNQNALMKQIAVFTISNNGVGPTPDQVYNMYQGLVKSGAMS